MSTTIAGYYDTLICGMVTDGNWSKLDAFYILAAPTQAIAQMNIACPTSGSTCTSTPFDLVVHGTGTFTANSNYAGNGSTGFLDTQYNPSSSGTQFTTTSGGVGVYILNARSTQNTTIVTGSYDGTHAIQILPYYTGGGGTASLTINDISGSCIPSTTSNNSQGFFSTNMFSGTTQCAIYNSQGGSPFTATNGNTNPAMTNESIYVGARNNQGSADSFSSEQIAAVFFSGNYTASQFSSRINAFMTSQGVNVY